MTSGQRSVQLLLKHPLALHHRDLLFECRRAFAFRFGQLFLKPLLLLRGLHRRFAGSNLLLHRLKPGRIRRCHLLRQPRLRGPEFLRGCRRLLQRVDGFRRARASGHRLDLNREFAGIVTHERQWSD